MTKIQKIIIATLVAIVIAIIMIWLIYKYTGWSSFSMNKGENFIVDKSNTSLIGNLQFKECSVSVSNGTTTKSFDITSTLNRMASAYKGNTDPNYVFKLSDPGLTAYSFQLSGFNDDNNKPDSSWDNINPTVNINLTGKYKILT